MIFMILFWIILGTAGILFAIDKAQKNERFEDIISYLVVLQLMLFFLAIATDDPVLPASWGVDPWWELTIEGVLAGFAVWKAYLNPMKRKVSDLDREVGEVKATMTVQYNELNKRIDMLDNTLNKKMDLIYEQLDKKIDRLLDIYSKAPH